MTESNKKCAHCGLAFAAHDNNDCMGDWSTLTATGISVGQLVAMSEPARNDVIDGLALDDHSIVWEFDHGSVTATAVCTAPDGADCRLNCDHGCESWSIERDHDGNPYHSTGFTLENGTEDQHDMAPVDYCNVTEFLNADPGDLLAELGTGQFVLARTPIEPVWEGDHYTWKRAEA